MTLFARLIRLLPRLVLALCAVPTLALATLVRVETASGPVDIDLLDTQAPITVTNFLNYVRAGDYDGTFMHRLAKNPDGSLFVLQGGGFTYRNAQLGAVPSRGNIANEFSATRPNARGSVAMAKQGGNANSANSQWFINLSNNTNLDNPNNNGGFTVFGRVTGPSMAVVDRLSAVTTVDANGTAYTAFGELPVYQVPVGRSLTADDLLTVTTARILPTTTATDSDRVFNLLEAMFPQFIPLKGLVSGTGLGYYFRHYPGTRSYLGTKDGNIYYLVPAVADEIRLLGPIADWLEVARANGY